MMEIIGMIKENQEVIRSKKDQAFCQSEKRGS